MGESELIQKARAGDETAFASLVEVYEKKVYHQALRLLNQPEDAADVTQEVFWKVWQGLPHFQGSAAFSTWLYRLTDNACIDLIRKEKKRRGDVPLEELPPDGALTIDAAPTPHEALERQELHQAVEKGLSALSEEHRRVLVLREINGLSYQQIAETLDLDLGTVKSRIARARMALSKFLKRAGNFSASSPSNDAERR